VEPQIFQRHGVPVSNNVAEWNSQILCILLDYVGGAMLDGMQEAEVIDAGITERNFFS
jgi:hypothetical protein